MQASTFTSGIAALMVVFGLSGCELVPGSDAQRIAQFKRDVRIEAGRDLDFQKVWVVDGVVCGEIGSYDTKNAFQVAGEGPRIEPGIQIDVQSLNSFSAFADEFLARCHPDFKRSGSPSSPGD